MASSSDERETSNRDEITDIIRQCVREEIDFQRSGRQGTSNILHRTRDLISNATTSACREYERRLPSPSPSTLPTNITVSSSKRPSTGGNPSHPWRFKKSKKASTKSKVGQVVTKSICLLDEPPAVGDTDDTVPDYTVVDDMVLLKGYCDFATTYTEAEIRREISETVQQRFPLMTPRLFDFVKRERNMIVTPVVKPSHKWDFKQVKELCGQGKLYIRLNVSTEALEMTEDSVSEEKMEKPAKVNEGQKSSCSAVSTNPSFPGVYSRNPASSASRSSFSPEHNNPEVHDAIEIQGDLNPEDSLQEMLPTSSAETIVETLSRCGGDINFTLDNLLNKTGGQEEELSEVTTLPEILQKLSTKMKSRPAKLTIDQDDLFNDAIAFYKNACFDPETPLRITFSDQPAIDGGGVLRQFFTDLFSCFIEGKHLSLFLGECNRKCPTHSPQVVFSGIIEIVGITIAHSLAQGGPGFPFLSLPCYYYLATGDVISAMAYCDPWDIPDQITRQWVQKVMDASSESDLECLAANDQFLDVFSSCGDTSTLMIKNKSKIIQSMASYDVIGKRKMALDQLRKGLKTLGLLDEMEKHPDLFESVFNQRQEELTPSSVRDHLLFPQQPEEHVQHILTMLVRFVNESPLGRLQSFVKFCTGSKDIMPLQNKKIEVGFHDESYIFSSTCSLKLQFPKSFRAYGAFEAARLLAVMYDCGKAFTTT